VQWLRRGWVSSTVRADTRGDSVGLVVDAPGSDLFDHVPPDTPQHAVIEAAEMARSAAKR
jgi:hypothetical protein